MHDPGDVILVDLAGAIEAKRRPAVIISTAAYHAARPDVVVGVVTSQVSKATSRTDYAFADWAAAGLHAPSAFRAYISTVPRSRIIYQIGTLSTRDWQGVRERVRLSLDV